MPSAEPHRKQKIAKAKAAAAAAAAGATLNDKDSLKVDFMHKTWNGVPESTDIHCTQGRENKPWDEYYIGEETRESYTQTGLDEETQWLEEMFHQIQVNPEETEDEDDEGEADSEHMTPEMLQEIAFLNSLSPEEFKMVMQEDYAEYLEEKDEDDNYFTAIDDENHAITTYNTCSWLNELD